MYGRKGPLWKRFHEDACCIIIIIIIIIIFFFFFFFFFGLGSCNAHQHLWTAVTRRASLPPYPHNPRLDRVQ